MKRNIFLHTHLVVTDKELEVKEPLTLGLPEYPESLPLKVQSFCIMEVSSEQAINALIRNAASTLAKAEDGWNNTNEYEERMKELMQGFNAK